jgi:hypothetical protein
MSAATTIPVTIDADAAARIDELGMQSEFRRLLDHTLQTVPDLCSVRVKLSLPYDTEDDTAITVEANRSVPLVVPDETWRNWSRWKVATFPPDVARWFQMTTVHEA